MQLDTFDNRRKENRRSFKKASVSWRTGATGPWLHNASLHDISTSGVCFLVPCACQPKVGQDIELFRNHKKEKEEMVCHVLHTEPWINHKTMVGGRVIVTSNRPAVLPQSSSVLKAREERQKVETKTNEQEKEDKNDDVEELWVRFRKERSAELRNLLVEHYRYLVTNSAKRICTKLPKSVAFEDLASAGVFGLIMAIETFDPDRNVKFSTYCNPRICGAMLDELRSTDWVPRRIRDRTKELSNICKPLEDEHGCYPSDEEIAESMGMTKDVLIKIKNDARRISLTPMNDSRVFENKRSEDPSKAFERRDLIDRLTRGLSSLEKSILQLYYFEDMSMNEVGVTLGLSGSQVSIIHSSIIARLRNISQDNDLQMA